MKHRTKLALAIAVAVVSAMLAVACSKGGGSLEAPAGLKLNTSGELSWTAVEAAEAYEVSVNGTDWTKITRTRINLLDDVTVSEGAVTVSVRAVTEKKTGKAATFALTAEKIAAPTDKPALADFVEENQHGSRVEWTAPDDVSTFLLELNGSGQWTTIRAANFVPNGTGTYTVRIKYRGRSESKDGVNKLYLTSDPGPASDPIEFLAGPVLDVPEINTVSITADSADAFDHYYLWVDGVKNSATDLKTLMDENGIVDLVEEGVITRTGEYDLQVEAVKGSTTAWSSFIAEWGTSNINEHEIFSFDNRKCSLTAPKNFFTISDEHKHEPGDTNAEADKGYSQKIAKAAGTDQANMLKYAGNSVNDIDFTTIKEISYWVYIPSDDPEFAVDYTMLPAVRWETSFNGNWFAESMYPAADTEIKYNEWFKATIPCEVFSSQVLIMVYNLTYDYYVDDICYEEASPNKAFPAFTEDYDKAVCLSGVSRVKKSWFSFNATPVDLGAEFANKEVDIKMQVTGNIGAGWDNGIAGLFATNYFWYKNKPASGASEIWNAFTDPVGTVLGTWNEITIKGKPDENGIVYLHAMNKPIGGNDGQYAPDDYAIFIKDVEVVVRNVPSLPAGAVEMEFKQRVTDASMWTSLHGFDVSDLGVNVGDQVKVTLKVAFELTINEWGGTLGYLSAEPTSGEHDGAYGFDGATTALRGRGATYWTGQADGASGVVKSADQDGAEEEDGVKWVTFEFTAPVISAAKVYASSVGSNYDPAFDMPASGKYVGVYMSNVLFKDGDWMFAKFSAVKDEGSVPAGAEKIEFKQRVTDTTMWAAIHGFDVSDQDVEVGDTMTVTLKIAFSIHMNQWCGGFGYFSSNPSAGEHEGSYWMGNQATLVATKGWTGQGDGISGVVKSEDQGGAVEEDGLYWLTYTFEAVVCSAPKVYYQTGSSKYDPAFTMPSKYIGVYMGSVQFNPEEDWMYAKFSAVKKVD